MSVLLYWEEPASRVCTDAFRPFIHVGRELLPQFTRTLTCFLPCVIFLTLLVFLQSSSTPRARRKQPASSTPDANASKRRKTVATRTSTTAAKAKSQTATTQSQGEQPRLTQSGVSKPVEPVADQVHDSSVPLDDGGKSSPEKMTGSFSTPPVELVKKSDWLNASQSASDTAGRLDNEGDASLPPPPINLSPPSFSTG